MLAAVIANVKLPTVVGVPDTVPVTGSKASPVGNEPGETVNVGTGLPVATN